MSIIRSLTHTCMEAICRTQGTALVANNPNITAVIPQELFNDLVSFQQRQHLATQVFIRRYSVPTYPIDPINLHIATVGDLRVLVATHDGQQNPQLFFHGNELVNDNETLAANGIQSCTTLHAI